METGCRPPDDCKDKGAGPVGARQGQIRAQSGARPGPAAYWEMGPKEANYGHTYLPTNEQRPPVGARAGPSHEERRQLEQSEPPCVRRRAQAEEMYLAELDRVGAGRGVMALRPRRSTKKFGQGKGEYAERMRGYDWYEGLAKKEQARLRDNGGRCAGSWESPDENS